MNEGVEILKALGLPIVGCHRVELTFAPGRLPEAVLYYNIQKSPELDPEEITRCFSIVERVDSETRLSTYPSEEKEE